MVKRGSAGDRVRFLQRALTAALHDAVSTNGDLGAGTTDAVAAYQQQVGLDPIGVADGPTWQALQSGTR